DYRGTIDAYYEAKGALFEQAGAAVVNVGDEYGRRLAAELPGAITFDSRSDVLDGVDLKLRGAFNHLNAVGAALAARALGVDDEAIKRGIESVDGVPGRFESIEEGQPFAVIVDYAHTPDSLENVIRAARGLGGRLVVVFGAGGDRDRAKRPLMGSVVSRLADRAILTSDNPRSEAPDVIAAEVASGAPGAFVVELDRRAAIERALAEAQPGDVVVLARRGAQPGQDPVRRPRGRARDPQTFVTPIQFPLLEPLGRLTTRPWANEVTGLQIDSRRIDEGDLFVAVSGGEDFTAHALARGAAAVLVPDDAHAGLATIAGAVRDRSSARVVAITGSTGKTTTKDILAALCSPHLRTVASEANYNNEL